MNKDKSHRQRLNTGLIIIGLVWSSILAAEEQPDSTTEPTPEPPVDLNAQRDQELADSLPPGQVKWIESGDGKFLALFNPDQTGNPRGSVMMVPAPGDTIQTPGVMTEAVNYFPSVAWHFMAVHAVDLSFQGPQPELPLKEPSTTTAEQNTESVAAVEIEVVLPDEQDWYQKQFKANQQTLVSRLAAAEQELLRNDKGYVLVVTSHSGSLVLEAIKDKMLKPKGLVLIDINYPVLSVRQQLTKNLAELPIPVLDIYSVVSRQLAEQRHELNRFPGYEQRMLPVTGRDFRGSEYLLLRTIRGWLKRKFP